MKMKSVLFWLSSLIFSNAIAQTDTLKTSHLVIGLGTPYSHFRDKVSSSLAYEGIGLTEFNVGKIKVNRSVSIKQLDFTFGIGKAKPNIENRTEWNKSATTVYYDFSYAILKNLNRTKNKKLLIYLGPKIASSAQYILYPTINNVRAYNFNWLSLQVSTMATYDFTFLKTKSQLVYQLSIPVFALNARPLGYTGVIPVESVWNQNENTSGAYFNHIKATSVHNNLIIQSLLAWEMAIRRNKVRISYTWLYQHNSVSVNTLNSVKSSVVLSYLINLKKRKNK